MAYLEIENISKYFPKTENKNEKNEVLDKFNLSVKENEFVCLFGPNGCGKTTLFKLIVGLLKPDAGEIKISESSPSTVNTSFIFQNYEETLLPWRNCLDNVSYPLETNGLSKKQARKIAHDHLIKLCSDFPQRKFPYQLSGGQKQMLAIYRALVIIPKLFLLDEPFNALDYTTRKSTEQKFLEIWERNRITTLFITHDVEEAIYLSDRVIVLSASPIKIIKELIINIDRPRTSDVLNSTIFFEKRKEIISAFESGNIYDK